MALMHPFTNQTYTEIKFIQKIIRLLSKCNEINVFFLYYDFNASLYKSKLIQKSNLYRKSITSNNIFLETFSMRSEILGV